MDNPWLDRRVLLYAHQGGAREAPSSTMRAMRHAVAHGADAIELDVHATIDGTLVVCHDTTVDRTTPATGSIATMTLAELRTLDNAYWWVPGHESLHDAPAEDYVLRGRYPDEPDLGIATLAEVLEAFPQVFINLDIKETSPNVEPYEAALADVLRTYERADDVIVASFNDKALEAFRHAAPHIHTSFGPTDALLFGQAAATGEPLPRHPDNMVALQVPSTFGTMRIINEQLLDAAHRAGLAVHAWTIDEADEMQLLLEMGVDGIMTDCPSVLSEVLGRHRMAWTR